MSGDVGLNPVLVTGASGLVGQALIQQLEIENKPYIALSRLPSKTTRAVDLCDAHSIQVALANQPLQAVVHAAAWMPSVQDPSRDFNANVTMTENLLAALQLNHVPYIVFISSIDVYQPGEALYTENSPIAPQTPYAKSKLESEECVLAWAKEHNVPICILRVSHLFGPGDRGTKFIPNVLRCLATGDPISLNGDGQDLRDYVYINDLAAVITRILEKQPTGILNVATGTSHSLRDVIDILSMIAGHALPLALTPRQKPQVDYHFDISRLNTAIGPIEWTDFAWALKQTARTAFLSTVSG